MINSSRISSMSFKEFCDYCGERTCDGQWPLEFALVCITTIDEINKIKYKKFGFVMRKKTDELREKTWQMRLEEGLGAYFDFVSLYYE